jgi:hypothetical protein
MNGHSFECHCTAIYLQQVTITGRSRPGSATIRRAVTEYSAASPGHEPWCQLGVGITLGTADARR